MQIIEGAPTWVENGKDAALKIKVDTSLALNDFYTNDNTLVSTKRNEGGFVNIVTGNLCDEKNRNTFITDMIITKIDHVDADEEKNIKEHTSIHGAIFDFKNAILPVDFIVENPAGMKYFENLDATSKDPIYTKVWGKIECETIVTEIKQESAFGEPSVTSREKKSRNWVILGASTEPYDFGDEKVITADELTKAIQDRQVYLADVKKRADEYKASKNTPAAAPVAAPAKKGNFAF